CIFCGKGGPFSREHVLPNWTAELIGLRRVEVRRRVLDGPPTTWQKVGSFGHTVTSVCVRCNTGWMSDLEDDTKPILSPLIYPREKRDVRLTPDEQIILAAWLWKIAILHADLSPEKYFTRAEREVLWRGDIPPD